MICVLILVFLSANLRRVQSLLGPDQKHSLVRRTKNVLGLFSHLGHACHPQFENTIGQTAFSHRRGRFGRQISLDAHRIAYRDPAPVTTQRFDADDRMQSSQLPVTEKVPGPFAIDEPDTLSAQCLPLAASATPENKTIASSSTPSAATAA